MCYRIFNKQGTVNSQYMVQHITKDEILYTTWKETLELADNKSKEKLADEKHELESCPVNKFCHKDILLDEE